MDDLNYKKDIIIEESQLDKEWILQPKLCLKWLEYEANCEKIYDKKKMELQVLYAELDKFIRSNSITKLREGDIESEILTNKEYKLKNDEVIEAKFNFNIATAAVKAFQDRKKALEKLVDLWITGYNSEPKQSIKDNILSGVQNKIRGGL